MHLKLVLGIFATTVVVANANLANKVPIDPSKKYYLGWAVENDEVVFEVEVETTGYVGFGISPSGSMAGADLFIGGVKDGQAYSGDYHAERNGAPTLDKHNDWDLLESRENATHTILKFARKLLTCDPQDYPIGADTNRLVWAIGEGDNITYHAERGTYSANILLPDDTFDAGKYTKVDTIVNNTMEPDDTTYWCTVHEGPKIDKKHHIVAFEPYLPSVEAVEYTHHLVLKRCTAPKGSDPDELFGSKVGDPGNHCYLSGDQQHLPTQYCEEQIFVWAKGGKRMVFPDNVGYPIGEDPTVKQYYMLEIHYDNPQKLEGIQFDTGFTQYITSNLREQEANLVIVGPDVNPSLTVPPNTTNFIVAGHCPSACTTAFLPDEGVSVFNILFHAHLSGRKLKLRHFRDGEEIPWLEHDDHYDFNYQQNKPLVQQKKLMPGDQLTLECVYDSDWKNGEAVAGGLSSRDEMCEAFLWYWPRTGLELCTSTYPVEQGFKDLGFTKYHLHETSNGMLEQYYIDAPESLRGDYLDTISKKVNWTDEVKEEFQETRRYGRQHFVCGALGSPDELWVQGRTQYVEVKEEYVPEDQCEGKQPTDPPTTEAPSTSSEEPSTSTDGAGSHVVLPQLVALIAVGGWLLN